MRLLLAALLVVLPSLADAQTATSGSRRSQPPPQPSIGLPLAPIGLPLADVTPALAPIGTLPGPTDTTSSPDRAPGRQRDRGPQRRGRNRSEVIYVVPAYGWGMSIGSAPSPADAPAPVATGTLWLDIEPRGVGEVYVDGYLAGTTLDVRGSMELDAGPHQVEIRADGYQPVGVAVRIEPGGVVTLRRALQPLAVAPSPLPAPAASAAPVAPTPIPRKPFYYIPGCYLGDVPPKDAGLPPSCDQSKTVVVRP
jgi:hypothetical protein